MPVTFYWIKLYYEILDDPKMGRVPDHLWRRAIELFLLAGECNNGGYLPDVDSISWRLRTTNADITDCLAELEALHIVTHEGNDWIVTNFSKRQGAQSNADRQRAYRERNGKSNETLHGGNEKDNEKLPEIEIEIENKDRDRERVTFDLVQSWIEQVTGLPASGESSTAAINKLLAEGVTQEDIIAGADWLRGQGKSLRYFSSIVGPAITEKSKRLQKKAPAPEPIYAEVYQ